MLGGGPLDGSPEPECEPAYDLVGIAEDQVEGQEARGEVMMMMLVIVMMLVVLMLVRLVMLMLLTNVSVPMTSSALVKIQ